MVTSSYFILTLVNSVHSYNATVSEILVLDNGMHYIASEQYSSGRVTKSLVQSVVQWETPTHHTGNLRTLFTVIVSLPFHTMVTSPEHSCKLSNIFLT